MIKYVYIHVLILNVWMYLNSYLNALNENPVTLGYIYIHICIITINIFLILLKFDLSCYMYICYYKCINSK